MQTRKLFLLWCNIALLVILTACSTFTKQPEQQAPLEPIRGGEMPASGVPVDQPSRVYPPPQDLLSPDNPVMSPPYPAPGDSGFDTWQPQPEDEGMTRQNAFVEELDTLVLESFPPQFMLSIQGTLPTPCNQLRVNVKEPDTQNQVQVEVYSLAKPDTICVQVLEPFQVQIPLKNLRTGHYAILANGQLAGEIDVP